MRILQISSAKTFGGGERHLTNLVRAMIDRGHEIFLAAPSSSPVLERLDDFPAENLLDVRIKNSLDLPAAGKIARFIREKNIEIVHAHLAKDYLPASFAVRLAPGARLVLTRHVLFPMKPFYRSILNNAARIIAVSAAAEAGLLKIFPPEKIAVVPNGIEVGKWADADRERLFREFRFLHDLPFDVPLIGTIGELKRLKGQQDFILAANELAGKFPEARFLIVGRDNSKKQDFRQELKRLVKIFDLEKRFLFLDWVEDTAPLLAALDIFVSASHTESFGLAILEAMASGTAIVATETEGAKELIADGRTGRLVPVRDPVRLAEAVGELLADQKLRLAFGRNARTAAGEDFSLERMIAETEKIYCGL